MLKRILKFFARYWLSVLVAKIILFAQAQAIEDNEMMARQSLCVEEPPLVCCLCVTSTRLDILLHLIVQNDTWMRQVAIAIARNAPK